MPPFSDAVVFGRRAFDRIGAECLGVTPETGGILIGRQVRDRDRIILVVAEATGPGRWADHRHLTFAPDHRALNRELEAVRRTWAADGVDVDYVGEWHKHPWSFTLPSSEDLHQAQRILAAPQYQLPWGEVLIAIATSQSAEFLLNIYNARRGIGGCATYECLVLPDQDIATLLRAPGEPSPPADDGSHQDQNDLASTSRVISLAAERAYRRPDASTFIGGSDHDPLTPGSDAGQPTPPDSPRY